MKSFYALLFFLTAVGSGFAQSRKVAGFVVDKTTQKPMNNVEISIKDSDVTAITNKVGAFELTIENRRQTTIVASHTGFKTLEIPIPAQDRFKFAMERDVIRLPEIELNTAPETGSFLTYASNALNKDLGNYKGQFTVYVTIDTTGSATAIHTTDTSKHVVESVNRMFSGMNKWKPGIQRGKKVNTFFKFDVSNAGYTQANSDFYKFLGGTIKYPAKARNAGVEGAVDVEFKVDSEGQVTQVSILSEPSADIGKEVKRVIELVPAKTIKQLAEVTGANQFALPLSFRLSEQFNRGPLSPSSASVHLLGEMVVTGFLVNR